MSLRSLLGIELPIIQAPMAGVQGSALAAAVSNAGGLGSLPCAMLSGDTLRQEMTTLAALTAKPFNVNFFCHSPPTVDTERETAWREALRPYYRDFGLSIDDIPNGPGRMPFDHAAADLLDEVKPRIVSFHFGLPSPDLMARVRATGAKIIACATTVDEARWLESRGVDAIVAQGLEAGGHRGNFLTDDMTTQMGTLALVPQVARAVKVPVIAAGGIADSTSATAALALGAAAVQIGTAYLLCPEATTSQVHRTALKSPRAQHTALTNLFSGRPARGIMNRLMEELGPMSDLPPAFPLATSAIAPLRKRAEAQGSGDFSPLWAGQRVSSRQELGAAAVTLQLADRLT